MRPLLFTSIPPRLRGVELDQPGGTNGQQEVIASWLAAGFQPVSVNLDREIDQHPHLPAQLRAHGVETMVVTPRTPVVTALPLCPLIDFLGAIQARCNESPITIINADIRLTPSSEKALAGYTSELGKTDYLVAQRTDISSDHHGRHRKVVHANGFDLISFHPDWLQRVTGSLTPSLAFGLPWWDHYLPLALAALGAHTRLLDPRWCEHEAHPPRWGWAHYQRVGREAARKFRCATECLTDSQVAKDWLYALERETTNRALPEDLAAGLVRAALHRRAPRILTMSVLGRLAAANVRLILQGSTHGPVP